MQADIASCEQRMLACIATDPALSRRAAIIQPVPGCGPVTAACLCAEIPELGTELGTLDRRQVASLLGLAPFGRDSGQRHGGCSIRGGRAKARHLLYMTSVAAIQWNPGSKACCERPTARGKPPRVALVAVMRKLASLLNTVLRQDRMWQAKPPSRQLEVAA